MDGVAERVTGDVVGGRDGSAEWPANAERIGRRNFAGIVADLLLDESSSCVVARILRFTLAHAVVSERKPSAELKRLDIETASLHPELLVVGLSGPKGLEIVSEVKAARRVAAARSGEESAGDGSEGV